MLAQVTDDEYVDVAADVVVTAGIRAEDERVANPGLPLEDRAQLGDKTDSPRVQLAEARIQRVLRVHPPHPKRTDAPALDESLPEQLLQRQLYRPRVAADPANEIARVEFLAGRARQQREQAGFGPRTLDVGHNCDDTSVSVSDTDVFTGAVTASR